MKFPYSLQHKHVTHLAPHRAGKSAQKVAIKDVYGREGLTKKITPNETFNYNS